MPALRWTLRYNGQTVVLSTDPLGWDEIDLQLQRDEKWRGLFYEFTNEYGFYCKGGGKELVDLAHEEAGSEGDVELDIEALCSNVYTHIYEGKLNMSSWREEQRGTILYSFLEVDPRGITPIIRKREDVEVDLLATESLGGVTLTSYTYGNYDLNLHSKVIFQESKLERLSDTTSDEDYELVRGLSYNIYHQDAIPLAIGELKQSYDQSDFWTTPAGIPAAITLANSGIALWHDTTQAVPVVTPVTYNWSLRMKGTFVMTMNTPVSTGASMTVTFHLIKDDDLSGVTGIYSNTIFTSGAVSNHVTQAFDFSSSGTVNMVGGDKIWAYWIIDFSFTIGLASDFFNFEFELEDDSFIDINADTTYTASLCPAIAIHEAWSRVCEGITDQTLAFKSEFFGRTNSQGISYASNGCGAFTAMSCGKNIRLLEYIRHPIVTSLKDMFESFDSIHGLSLQVELHNGIEVVRVEEADYAYQDTVIFRAVNVPKIETSFSADMCYNELEIGYTKWETESANGIDEPNTKAKWTFTGIKNIKNVFSALCKFIAGMYAIELTRRQIPQQTEDYKYDNDNFIFALKRDVTQLNICEKNENFASVTNLISPSTAYNLRFNLYSNFKRLMNLFTTGLTKQTPQTIKYTSFEGNKDMTYAYNADGCVGDHLGATVQNVQDTTYPDVDARRGDPILLPETINFDYPVSFVEWLAIKANPRGKVEFSGTESDFKSGHLKLLSYNLKTSLARFTLVRRFE